MKCICVFQRTCGGSGVLCCHYCGGDFCICRCGGEVDCYGCVDCESPDDEAFDENDVAGVPPEERKG